MNTAAWALLAIVELLDDGGVIATRDPGAFFPQPTGVLVGLPSLTGGTLGARTYTVPVYVVSGEPLSTTERVNDLYDLADTVAAALDVPTYEPFDFRGSSSPDPLPAVRILCTATVPIPVPTPMEG